jgi:hypothetical protein
MNPIGLIGDNNPIKKAKIVSNRAHWRRFSDKNSMKCIQSVFFITIKKYFSEKKGRLLN